jgi:hypothetical protein
MKILRNLFPVLSRRPLWLIHPLDDSESSSEDDDGDVKMADISANPSPKLEPKPAASAGE